MPGLCVLLPSCIPLLAEGEINAVFHTNFTCLQLLFLIVGL